MVHVIKESEVDPSLPTKPHHQRRKTVIVRASTKKHPEAYENITPTKEGGLSHSDFISVKLSPGEESVHEPSNKLELR